jgi:hypothetical protein
MIGSASPARNAVKDASCLLRPQGTRGLIGAVPAKYAPRARADLSYPIVRVVVHALRLGGEP